VSISNFDLERDLFRRVRKWRSPLHRKERANLYCHGYGEGKLTSREAGKKEKNVTSPFTLEGTWPFLSEEERKRKERRKFLVRWIPRGKKRLCWGEEGVTNDLPKEDLESLQLGGSFTGSY